VGIFIAAHKAIAMIGQCFAEEKDVVVGVHGSADWGKQNGTEAPRATQNVLSFS
jgi:hypothetical protein